MTVRMGGQKRTTVESSPSMLLTAEENNVVRQLLGQRCPSLATTVVQIYKSEGPQHNRWNKRMTGVVCFVKDNPKRSYFIRVFDMDRRIVVFDQELYNQFRYKTPRPFFHTFEAEDGQIGLNFADESEAAYFHQIVENKLAERRQRRERRQAVKRHSLGASTKMEMAPLPPPSAATAMPMPNGNNYNAGSSTASSGHQPAHHYFSKNKGKGEKKKLRKEDISLPTNFQHISHVGWDPNRGFDLENVDPKLKKFFSRAGVSERELQDKETRDFIYEFIERHGGVEAALMEEEFSPMPPFNNITNAAAAAAQQQSAPAPPPRHSSIARPPPPPSMIQASPSKPPPPETPPVQLRPPPPHHNNQQQLHVQQQQQPSPNRHPTMSPPPPPPPPIPSTKSAAPMPPPPPPPPPPAAPAAPPAPPMPPAPPNLPPVDDFRSNLMAQIRQGGGTLRHVDNEKKARPSIDTRGVLLDQIRSGVTLKKVDPETLKSADAATDDSVSAAGIAGMLQKALQERSAALNFSSSDEEEDEEEDEEWD